MEEKEIIAYWIKNAEEDFKTAQVLFETKRYHHSLFFCHLFIEKTLKAIYITKHHTAPPWTHDLLKLAKEGGLRLSPDLEENLREISRFNIAARYDDYKFAFYKKATKEFTQKYFDKAKEIYLWLRKKI